MGRSLGHAPLSRGAGLGTRAYARTSGCLHACRMKQSGSLVANLRRLGRAVGLGHVGAMLVVAVVACLLLGAFLRSEAPTPLDNSVAVGQELTPRASGAVQTTTDGERVTCPAGQAASSTTEEANGTSDGTTSEWWSGNCMDRDGAILAAPEVSWWTRPPVMLPGSSRSQVSGVRTSWTCEAQPAAIARGSLTCAVVGGESGLPICVHPAHEVPLLCSAASSDQHGNVLTLHCARAPEDRAAYPGGGSCTAAVVVDGHFRQQCVGVDGVLHACRSPRGVPGGRLPGPSKWTCT